MATFTSFGDYGPYTTGWMDNVWKALVGFDGVVTQQTSSTSVKTYIVGSGYYTIINGTNLHVGSSLSWDTLTSVSMYLDNGTLKGTITGAMPLGGDAQDMIGGALGGNDTVDGSNDHDFMRGGGGADTLNGSAGQDIMIGEQGDDLFILHAGDVEAGEVIDGWGFSFPPDDNNTAKLAGAGTYAFYLTDFRNINVIDFDGDGAATAQVSGYIGTVPTTQATPIRTVDGSAFADTFEIVGPIAGAGGGDTYDYSTIGFTNWTAGQDLVKIDIINTVSGSWGDVRGTTQNDLVLINVSAGAGSLKGNTGDDTFEFTTAGNFTATIDGGLGNDTIQLDAGAVVSVSRSDLGKVENVVFAGAGATLDVTQQPADYNATGLPTFTGSSNVDTLVFRGENVDLTGIQLQNWTDKTDTLTIVGTGGGTLVGSNYSERLETAPGAPMVLDGRGGDDVLVSTDRHSFSYGGSTLIGGAGNDTLTGNNFADTFKLDAYDTVQQTDTVTNFSIEQGDRIDLGKTGPASWEVLKYGALGFDPDINETAVVGFFNDTFQRMVLKGISLDALTANQFIFDTSTTARIVAGSANEDVLFGGLGGDTLNGGDDDDSLIGDAGDDTLIGGDGYDHFYGGAGNDTLVGGAGGNLASYLIGSSQGVRVDLSLTGYQNTRGAGYDKLSDIDNLEGSRFDDFLTGNAHDNFLGGDLGNDTLDGAGGADYLAGEAGNDIYFVDDPGDTVDESDQRGVDPVTGHNRDAGGTDLVKSLISFSLPGNFDDFGNVENLTLIGTDAIDATGNALNNVLTGNGNSNTLRGLGGSDTLLGLGGDDTYYVDGLDIVREAANGGSDKVFASASFTLLAGAEVELLATGDDAGTGAINLTGNEFAQTIRGNAGANQFVGRGGGDTLIGLGGNDVYYVSNSGDTVTEAVGGGADAISTSVSYALGAGQEIETLAGNSTSALTLTGNEFANKIVSGKGVDTLIGLGGDDKYYVNFALDSVTEATGGGNDTVYSTVTYRLAAGQEVEVMSANAGSTGITLTGNEFNNALISGLGNDTLAGKGGNDTYYVNNTGDTVNEAVGGGTDTVRAGVSYALAANQEVETLMANAGSTGLTLTGNNLSNYLLGGAGADTLIGGLGRDSFTGAGGNDKFVFNDVAESGIATPDSILDFTAGDKVDIHLIDADGNAANGDTAFILDVLGDNSFATGHIKQTLSGSTLFLSFNTDGDSASEMVIALLNHGVAIGGGDLIA